MATRLARRGVDAASVRELFRFVVREALGRPSSAAIGRLTEAATGTSLAGVRVAALLDGEVRSTTRSDAEGGFALDWLEAGKAYQIEVIDYSPGVGVSRRYETDLPDGTVTVPDGAPVAEDLLGLAIQADSTPLPANLSPGCTNCDLTQLAYTEVRRPIYPLDSDMSWAP